MLPQLLLTILFFTFSATLCSSTKSIYDALKSQGLPMGILPKGISNFTLNTNGSFQVYLEQECISKFENELHYDKFVSGTLLYGQVVGLTGISAQDLFLWFPVKEIHVDVPSSGLIYFDVGVVSKQFSLSSFETPRECKPVTSAGTIAHPRTQNMEPSRKLRFGFDNTNLGKAVS